MTFSPDVYERIREGCQRSAEAVVPFVYDLCQPTTVADIGGGEGWWGRAFFDRGCDVLVADDSEAGLQWKFEAVSGPDPHRIDFLPVDLTLKAWSARVASERAEIARIHGGSGSFDIALCLEVAEHLPDEAADHLVAGLCALAPAVLFSAAIPGQGGHGHINEQWPDYWTTRFMQNGYEGHDCLRPRFWDDPIVEPWYRQNIVLYVREFSPLLRKAVIGCAGLPLALVHPDIYAWRISERDELAAKLTDCYQTVAAKMDG